MVGVDGQGLALPDPVADPVQQISQHIGQNRRTDPVRPDHGAAPRQRGDRDIGGFGIDDLGASAR